MKWLLLIVLASLIFLGWALLSSGGAEAAGVLLILIAVGFALSLSLRVTELRTAHDKKNHEIITGSPPRIWSLMKFAGYEVTDLRWERKIFGGYWIRRRIVHAHDFPTAHRRSAQKSRTEQGLPKL